MINRAWWIKASGWLVAVSILTFLIGLILVPIVVLRLSADFFIKEEEEHHWHFPESPSGWAFWIGRNAFGAFLVIAGIAMLVLPGQGILTIVAGIMAMTLPGKRKVVLWLVHWGRVQRSLNWIRKRGRKPPLLFSEPKVKRPYRKQVQQKSPK